LKPGGSAIIEVPAASSLYDIYDRVLMHRRRYDMTRYSRNCGRLALTSRGIHISDVCFIRSSISPSVSISCAIVPVQTLTIRL